MGLYAPDKITGGQYAPTTPNFNLGVLPNPIVNSNKTQTSTPQTTKSQGALGIAKDFFTGGDNTTGGVIRNTGLGLSNAGAEVATQIGQGIARTVGAIGITAGNRAFEIGKLPKPFEDEIPTTGNPVTNALFGGQPIQTVPKQIATMQSKLSPYTGDITSKYLATPLVLGSMALDLSGFGGKAGVKSFSEDIPEAFFKFLAKESNPGVINSTLKSIGLDETNAKVLSMQLAPTKTVNEAKDVLANFNKTQPVGELGTLPKPETPVSKDLQPLAQEAQKDTITLYRAAPNFPTDNFKKGTYFADTPEKARYYSESHYNGNPSDIKVQQFTLPKDAVFKEPSTGNYTIKGDTPVKQAITENPLITEAQKYKSAEEFVKAVDDKPELNTRVVESTKAFRKELSQETIDDIQNEMPDFAPNSDGTITLYHKTTADAENAIDSSGKIKEGTYFATSEEAANALASTNKKGEPVVMELRIDPSAITHSSEESFAEHGLVRVGNKWTLPDSKIEELYGLKTKSQLTDIWNKVNKTETNPSQKIVEQSLLKSQTTETTGKLPTTQKIPISPETKIPTQSLSPSYKESQSQNFDAGKYVSEQVSSREKARLSEKVGVVGKTKSFLANAKAKLVDFTAPIEDTLNKAVKENKITLKPEEDIHNQIDRVLRSPTLAGQFAKDNGIVDVIKKVDNPDALDQYLIAQHAVELESRGITTGRDLVKDKLLLKALAPKYEPYAKIVYQYSQNLLDYSVESGLISKDLADLLKEKYPNYVPFNRVFNEIEKQQGYGTNAVASLSKQSIIQKIEGSEREIESPIKSLLAKTNDAFKQGEKNLAGKLLSSYKDLPNNPFQLRELGKGETAEHTISFLDKGVKKIFETTKEISEAAKALNVQQLNILGKIFAFPVRVARVGITGINLPFIGANIAKDQVTAFINSSNGLRSSIVNPVNFVKALFSAVGHGKLYQEMVRAGGAGTSFDIARNQVEQTVSSIRAGRNFVSKILYTVRHPSELLRSVENIVSRGEELTRIQQYRAVKQSLLSKGMSEKSAIIGGARQARDATVNFARRGEWGTVLNSAFLYINASIQGTRTLLRNLKTKPLQTGIKIVVSALLPMAIATAWNLSDPKRKKVYDDIAEYEKENNIIIITPGAKKDSRGRWNVIKIPLSQEINNLVSLARRPIEAAHNINPLKFSDFASALIGTVSPINPTTGSMMSTLTPQAIRPTLEGALNKNVFTGKDQVPSYLTKLPSEKQIHPYTSGTARKIGGMLNVSPIKVEEFIKGTFGGVGSQALNVVDKFMAGMGAIPKDQIGGQDILDAISARFGKAQSKPAGAKKSGGRYAP